MISKYSRKTLAPRSSYQSCRYCI